MDWKNILNAKVGKVPIIAVGIPVVILIAVFGRMFGKKDTGTVAAADTGDTGTTDPIFLAKTPPANWLAVNPQTGLAYSPDGSVTYAPVSQDGPVTPTPTNADPAVPQPDGDAAPAPSGPAAPPVQPPVPATPNAATKNTAKNYGNFVSKSVNNTTANVAAAYGLSEAALLKLNPGLSSGKVPVNAVVKVRSDAVPYKA